MEQQPLLKRIKEAFNYTVRGVRPDAWMSPQQPMIPVAQEQSQGRLFDYPVAVNLQPKPKLAEGIEYNTLRELADNCDLVRACIETRKDQISRFDWKIQYKDKEVENDKRCEEIEKFFQFPDKEHSFDEWMRMIIEDLLVVDAPTIYPVMTNGNKPFAFEIIDGTTIKRVIDDTGRTPKDGKSPAYQQYLKGLPANDYTYNELIYKPRNLRAHKIYGYSPVEQVVTTVNIYLRKVTTQLSYYTEGNTPNLLIRAPEEWSPNQIRDFQLYWDEINTGINKNKAKFVPHGIDPYDTKPIEQKNEYDEWLTRIIFFAFSISPSAMVSDTNRATAQTNASLSQEEGLYPLLEWFKGLMDLIIARYFGYDDIEFIWDSEPETDPLIKAQINQIYINSGVLTADEIRKELGLDPLSEEDKANFQARQQAMQFTQQPKEDKDPQGQAEKIQKKKYLRRGIDDFDYVFSAKSKIDFLLYDFFGDCKQQYIDNIDIEEEETTVNKPQFDNKYWLLLIGGVATQLKRIGTVSADNIINHYDFNDIKDDIYENVDNYSQQRAASLFGKKIEEGKVFDDPDAEMSIIDKTVNDINNLVSTAMDEGWSNQKLAEAISDSTTFDKDRSMMIAQTETNYADNTITFDAFEKAGVKSKAWITGKDDKCCEICQANEDQGVIDINDTFSSGDAYPPSHPRCRCTIIAVYEEE